MVNIRGTFAADDREYNGLEAITEELIDTPLTRRVVVGTIETTRIVNDVSNGGVQAPTVRFVQLEVLDGADAEQAKAMLDGRYRARTGRDEGPQDSLFDGPQNAVGGPWPGDVDYDTPEEVETA